MCLLTQTNFLSSTILQLRISILWSQGPAQTGKDAYLQPQKPELSFPNHMVEEEKTIVCTHTHTYTHTDV